MIFSRKNELLANFLLINMNDIHLRKILSANALTVNLNERLHGSKSRGYGKNKKMGRD
jgi:hypothetical protein